MQRVRAMGLGIAIFVACGFSVPRTAEAGCGCEKPPPVPADVRPRATCAAGELALFHPALVPGDEYTVEFASGTTPQSVNVQVVAVSRRDLADGVVKPQVVLTVPELPLGPTAITVEAIDGSIVLSVGDDGFTIVPQPIVVPSVWGEYHRPDFQAAVSRDGIVYLSLDMSSVADPLVFRAQALGLPLRFGGDDAAFYNRQGFSMQQYDAAMPGLFSIEAAADSSNSDVLQYSRHEFNTFYLQHTERQAHEVDAEDGNWHLDGTPHIDHDHLVLAIAATMADGSVPAPGATPAFDLVLETHSLFRQGIVGLAGIDMDGSAVTDSYSSVSSPNSGSQGDALSNGLIRMQKNSKIRGNATAFDFALSRNARITGETTYATEPVDFMPVKVPTVLQDLGDVVLRAETLTLTGPASYRMSSLDVDGSGVLDIQNGAGPVTLYVTGAVTFGTNGTLWVTDGTPEKFAVYVLGPGPVTLAANATLSGVFYAPDAPTVMSGNAVIHGAIVAQQLEMLDRSSLYFDIALKPSVSGSDSSEPSDSGGSGPQRGRKK